MVKRERRHCGPVSGAVALCVALLAPTGVALGSQIDGTPSVAPGAPVQPIREIRRSFPAALEFEPMPGREVSPIISESPQWAIEMVTAQGFNAKWFPRLEGKHAQTLYGLAADLDRVEQVEVMQKLTAFCDVLAQSDLEQSLLLRFRIGAAFFGAGEMESARAELALVYEQIESVHWLDAARLIAQSYGGDLEPGWAQGYSVLAEAIGRYETSSAEFQLAAWGRIEPVVSLASTYADAIGNDYEAIRFRNMLLYHEFVPLKSEVVPRYLAENARSYFRRGHHAEALNLINSLEAMYPDFGWDNGSFINYMRMRARILSGEMEGLGEAYLDQLAIVSNDPRLEDFPVLRLSVDLERATGLGLAASVPLLSAMREDVHAIRKSMKRGDQRQVRQVAEMHEEILVRLFLYSEEAGDQEFRRDVREEMREFFPDHSLLSR
ncbi:MAG: hypothetical protein ACF8MJ_08330 [Phycisphaerales bacterium JB050]